MTPQDLFPGLADDDPIRVIDAALRASPPGDPEKTATRILQLVAEGGAMNYADFSSKDYPELRWRIWRLKETGEVAVIASVGSLSLGITQATMLGDPNALDSDSGIKVLDMQVAVWLSDTLWKFHGERLIAGAIHSRKSSQ